VQLGSKRGDNIGLALSRGCIEMTWRESDEVTEIADELEERERSEEVNCCHLSWNPVARVLCATPEQDLRLYVVFRMSSLYGVTTLALRSLGDV
jgi:hypothetical protein